MGDGQTIIGVQSMWIDYVKHGEVQGRYLEKCAYIAHTLIYPIAKEVGIKEEVAKVP